MIGLNQSNLSKAGQQIGQVISDSAEKAIGNVTSKNIGRYFRVNKSDSQSQYLLMFCLHLYRVVLIQL